MNDFERLLENIIQIEKNPSRYELLPGAHEILDRLKGKKGSGWVDGRPADDPLRPFCRELP